MVRGEIKNCTPLWREVRFQVKMYKTRQLRTTFGSSDVEKLHAAVARSTFSSENVQNTSGPDHFLPFRWRKIARRCGEKQNVKKTDGLGALFEVPMSKKLHAAVARSTFVSQNVQNTCVLAHFLKFRCRKIARRCGEKHICKSKCTKYLCFGALFEVQMSKN